MHRLFVALRPPRAIRQQLLALDLAIPDARVQDDEQLHLTLRFIGEVDAHRADDIAAALAQVHAPALDLRLGSFGRFAHRGRADALWIAVEPAEPLAHLHRKIDQAVVRAGLPPEGRAFVPHITLARLGRGAPPLDGLVAQGPRVTEPEFRATDFCLYESELGRAGATYTIVERYPLRG